MAKKTGQNGTTLTPLNSTWVQREITKEGTQFVKDQNHSYQNLAELGELVNQLGDSFKGLEKQITASTDLAKNTSRATQETIKKQQLLRKELEEQVKVAKEIIKSGKATEEELKAARKVLEENSKTQKANEWKEKADNLLKNDNGDLDLSKGLKAVGLDKVSGVVDAVQGIAAGAGSAVAALGTVAVIAALIKKIVEIVQGISKSMSEGVSNAANLTTSLMPKIESRLDGLATITKSGDDGVLTYWHTLANSKTATSPYYRQENYLKNIATLTESGIAYNLEERALLETVGEKLVSTFEVNNETLNRLIRIQQTDSTMAYMGNEAILTRVFNSMFEDTSYLSSLYDTVTNTLSEALGTMDTQSASEFQFQVQKWLGSMYSLGVSENAITTIAKSIAGLATGDVNSLDNSLLALLGASSSGVNIANAMTSGLSEEGTNQLMQGIISTLSDISGNSSNAVKSTYANLLGISVSDLTAIGNLTDEMQTALSSITSTYSDSVNYVMDNVDAWVVSRTSTAERMENAVQNAFLNWGMNIATDESDYKTYRIAELVGGSGLANFISGISTMFDGESSIFKTLSNSISGWFGTSDVSIRDALETYASGTSRGTGFSLPSGIPGSSYSAIYNTTGDDTIYYSEASTGTTKSVATEETSWTLDSLAEKLFSYETAIGVRIKSIDSVALNALSGNTYKVNVTNDFDNNGVSDISDILTRVRAWE